MFPLIINVAHVLITVNSSAHGVPAVFWALSHRKRCPVSFVKKGARNKEAEGGTISVFVYFRGGGPGMGNCMWPNMVVLFDGMTEVWDGHRGVLGRKVENVECVEGRELSIILLIHSFIFGHMFKQRQNSQTKGLEKHKTSHLRTSKFFWLIHSLKSFLLLS